jgi:hypothetical protein
MEKASIVNIISLIIILITPLLRQAGVEFQFVGNTLVRMLLVVYIIYASYLSVFSGLLAFLAVFTLLLERNHGILTGFPNVRTEIPIAQYQVDQVPVGIPTVNEEEPEMEDNAVHLKDNIPRLENVPKGVAAADFYKKHSLI